MIRIFPKRDSRQICQHLDESKFQIACTVRDADIILITGVNIAGIVSDTLKQINYNQRIFTEPCDVPNDNRIVMFDLSSNDPCTVNFTNYMYSGKIEHVDITIHDNSCSMITSLIYGLQKIRLLCDEHAFDGIKIRMSKFQRTMHCNGYCQKNKISFSIFIHSLLKRYKEEWSVYLHDDRHHTFTGPDEYTFLQRYICAFENALSRQRSSISARVALSKIKGTGIRLR